MVQYCARVIAPGLQASAKSRQLKKTHSEQIGLAPLAQGATLTKFSTLKILMILGTLNILSLRTLSQLTGLGPAGAGGKGAAI